MTRISVGIASAFFGDSGRTMRLRPCLRSPRPGVPPSSLRLRGAVCSSAQASRWFAPGRCTSQQVTVQKTSPVRLRLQVETLHVQYIAPNAMGFLQALHRRHRPSSATGPLLAAESSQATTPSCTSARPCCRIILGVNDGTVVTLELTPRVHRAVRYEILPCARCNAAPGSPATAGSPCGAPHVGRQLQGDQALAAVFRHTQHREHGHRYNPSRRPPGSRGRRAPALACAREVDISAACGGPFRQ